MEALKNQGGIAIFDFPDAQRSSFGGVWKTCFRVLGCLGQSWCVPGAPGIRLGCVLERLGCVLEVSWGHLAASWGGLGGILGSLGASWEHFGSILGAF